MTQLTNLTISKVFKGPDGDGEHGHWQIYNIYFKNENGQESQNKFTYFQSGKKPIPEKGMKVPFLEYESEKKGKYTNHTIKEIKFDFGSIPNQPNKPAPEPTNGKAFINHGEVALKIMELCDYDSTRIPDMVEIFKNTIDDLTTPLPNKPEHEPDVGQEEESPFNTDEDEDEIPW